MFSVDLKCGHCNHLVDFVFDFTAEHTVRTPEEIKALGQPQSRHTHLSVRTLNEDDIVSASAASSCPRCYSPALIVYECKRITQEGIGSIVRKKTEGNIIGGARSITVTDYYPKPKEADQSPDWPESLRKIFADTQDMLVEGKSPSIIVATARSVLELALKELTGLPDLTLYKRIEHLHDTGVITTPIKDWAHSIRLDGNAGTHSGVGEEQEAKEYVEFLKLFLDMTFSLPKRIEAKRQA